MLVGTIPIDATLPAGPLFLDALAALMAGPIESACLTIEGGAFGPFAYVIPSLPPDPSHAAYYSDTRRPPGLSQIQTGAITLGTRDGTPFFHCHALWTEADGRQGCGHVMPNETIIGAPVRVRGMGIAGARFEVHPDPETGFSLFRPIPTGTPPPAGAGKGVALRLAPNQDLTGALEQAGRAAGFAAAQLHGGVASLIGARFATGPAIEAFATELAVRHGHIRCDPAEFEPTTLDIAIVDYTGVIATGRLVNGENPVLMTFEGLLAGL